MGSTGRDTPNAYHQVDNTTIHESLQPLHYYCPFPPDGHIKQTCRHMRRMKEYTGAFDLATMPEIYFIDDYVSMADILHRERNLDLL